MLRQFTIEKLAFISLIALLFAIALRAPVDTDTWWHLRSGDYTLTQGMIYSDPFSHTFAGDTWINHSWGAQIIMLGFYQTLGDAGLMIFQAGLAVAGMFLLYQASTGSVYARGFLLVLGASTASVFWSARPQMLSFFFTTLVLFIIFRAKQGKTVRWWWIPLMMWLWSNLHAGWSIGYLLWGAMLVGETLNHFVKTSDNYRIPMPKLRLLFLGVVLSVPLLVVSPYGLDNLLVPLNTVSIGSLREFIQEWSSPDFQGRETWPFIASMTILWMTLWLSRRSFDWTSWFLLSGTLFMALLYGRNVAVFAVVMVPILAYHLDDALNRLGWVLHPRQRVTPMQGRLNLILATVLGLSVAIYGLSILVPPTIREARMLTLPVEAVEHLNENDYEGQLFNSYNWGGYLIQFAPQYPVFIDGRTDLYGEFLRVYRATTVAQGDWRDVLTSYDIGLVLVENGIGLDAALREDATWQLVYEDDLAVIHQLVSNESE
jgi:hypothetical protein